MQVNLDAKFVASFLYAIVGDCTSVYIHMKDVAYCKFVSLSDGVFFSCGKIFLGIFSLLVANPCFRIALDICFILALYEFNNFCLT